MAEVRVGARPQPPTHVTTHMYTLIFFCHECKVYHHSPPADEYMGVSLIVWDLI